MKVHIQLSDSGWILERLAHEIADRYPYVTYGSAVQPGADLYYFVTYNSFVPVPGAISVALFTHAEEEPEARKRFESVVRNIDHAVAMSPRYEALIREMSATPSSVIRPGVDTAHFTPRLRVGVAGRTYPSGRKGEHLVTQVLEHPGVEWVFTGEGWPNPGLHPADAELPDFYRSVDYLLVPSLWEGGPMSVVEALACGTPVIAPEVGWVEDYPHIPYELGNIASLRVVLDRLVAEKWQLAESVQDQSWQTWADSHDHLFRQLVGTDSFRRESRPSISGDGNPISLTVRLSTSAAEGFAQGGPSVRVPQLAAGLRSWGINTAHDLARDVDLEHVFNVWPPEETATLINEARRRASRVVLSPIFLDLSERPYWSGELVSRLTAGPISSRAALVLEEDATRLQARVDRADPLLEPVPGYFGRVRAMCRDVDALILLSEREQLNLAAIGVNVDSSFIVRNAPPYPFVERANGSDLNREVGDWHVDKPYFVCVGRIEPRKNQLMLAQAMSTLDAQLVLVGQSPNRTYAQAIRDLLGTRVTFTGHIAHGSATHRRILGQAQAFALTSWAEGAPLAALEAYAMGVPMVLGNRSGEAEYFGESAAYVNPGSLEQTRTALANALAEGAGNSGGPDMSQAWSQHVMHTINVYAEVSERPRTQCREDGSLRVDRPTGSTEPVDAGPVRLLFDLTTTRAHSAHLTGISRLEIGLASHLAARDDMDCIFTVWLDERRSFFEIPREVIATDHLRDFLRSGGGDALRRDRIRGRTYLIVGSSWMQNHHMATDLVDFVHTNDLRLVPMIMDLIPTLFPYWQRPGSPEKFTVNLRRMLAASSRILTISESTKRDLQQFVNEEHGHDLEIEVVRLADVLEVWDRGLMVQDASRIARWVPSDGSAGVPFVLAVGAVLPRKNYELLHRTWVSLASELLSVPDLVIVGGVGPEGERIAQLLSEDPRTVGRIHILDGISDMELIALYDGCLLSTYPSLYEGWGLPVAESLARGKICIASSRSSIPEIDSSLSDLVDPADFTKWKQRFVMYLRSPGTRKMREAQIQSEYTPTTWSSVANQVSEAAGKPGLEAPRKSVFVNEAVVLGDDRIFAACGGPGWLRRDGEARSPMPSGAEVRLTLEAPGSSPLCVAVEGKSVNVGASSHARIEVNGTSAGVVTLPPGPWSVVSVSLPMELATEGMLNLRVIPDAEPNGLGSIAVRRLAVVDTHSAGAIDRVFPGTEAHLVLEVGRITDLTRVSAGIIRGVTTDTDTQVHGVPVDIRGLVLSVSIAEPVAAGMMLHFRMPGAALADPSGIPWLAIDGCRIPLRFVEGSDADWVGELPEPGLDIGLHEMALKVDVASRLIALGMMRGLGWGGAGLAALRCESTVEKKTWEIYSGTELGIDWNRGEAGGCWSRCSTAGFQLDFGEPIQGRWILSLGLSSTAIAEGSYRDCTIKVAGVEKVVRFHFGSTTAQVHIPVEIPSETPTSHLDVFLECSYLVQLSAETESMDSRMLGVRLGRIDLIMWSEAEYLTLNPDVDDAVETRVFLDGFDHFRRFGMDECRSLRLPQGTLLEDLPPLEKPTLYRQPRRWLARGPRS